MASCITEVNKIVVNNVAVSSITIVLTGTQKRSDMTAAALVEIRNMSGEGGEELIMPKVKLAMQQP